MEGVVKDSERNGQSCFPRSMAGNLIWTEHSWPKPTFRNKAIADLYSLDYAKGSMPCGLLYAALTVSFVRLVTADHLRRRKEEMRLGQAATSQQMLQTYDITFSHDRAKLLRNSRMCESHLATILNVFMNQEILWGLAWLKRRNMVTEGNVPYLEVCTEVLVLAELPGA